MLKSFELLCRQHYSLPRSLLEAEADCGRFTEASGTSDSRAIRCSEHYQTFIMGIQFAEVTQVQSCLRQFLSSPTTLAFQAGVHFPCNKN